MSAGYKQALARFEAAVRADTLKGTTCRNLKEVIDVEHELERARHQLVIKLQHRKLKSETGNQT